jgi:hypothetical protein
MTNLSQMENNYPIYPSAIGPARQLHQIADLGGHVKLASLVLPRFGSPRLLSTTAAQIGGLSFAQHALHCRALLEFGDSRQERVLGPEPRGIQIASQHSKA